MKIDLIIFDFDGVVVDSELVACGVLASVATELGHPMTPMQAVDRFGGSTIPQQVMTLEKLVGRGMASGFGTVLQRRTMQALESVPPIPGIVDFLASLDTTPICIGSTSTLDRIETCLVAIGLLDRFASRIFSVSMVARNKPFPDIFLYCAQKLGAAPERTIVIEDSCHGIEAAVAAGMYAIGLTAASHLKPDHHVRLQECGARRTFRTFDEVQNHLKVMGGRHASLAACEKRAKL